MEKMELKLKTLRDFLEHRDELDGVAALFDEAPGAIPNGTKIVKCNTAAGDTLKDGAPGIVIGSVGPNEMPGHPNFGYFVLWEYAPEVPCFIFGTRIKRA